MTMSEYIEREAAEKVASKYGCTNGVVIGRHSGLADCIALEIAKLPAAEVVPVRHGRWEFPVFDGQEELDPRVKCSECGVVEVAYAKWNYCPNCGAKMDLED
nr:MAG TPA: Putative toxin VapC6 domain, ZN ribbon domain [Caudoviricetes sp.]